MSFQQWENSNNPVSTVFMLSRRRSRKVLSTWNIFANRSKPSETPKEKGATKRNEVTIDMMGKIGWEKMKKTCARTTMQLCQVEVRKRHSKNYYVGYLLANYLPPKAVKFEG